MVWWGTRSRAARQREYFSPERIDEILGLVYLHSHPWPGIYAAWPELLEISVPTTTPVTYPPTVKSVTLFSETDENDEHRRLEWRYKPFNTSYGVGHVLEGQGTLMDKHSRAHLQNWTESLDLFMNTGLIVAKVLRTTAELFNRDSSRRWEYTTQQ